MSTASIPPLDAGSPLDRVRAVRAAARLACANDLAARALAALAACGLDARIIGSLADGRFRLHSDIDILARGPLDPRRRADAESAVARVMRDGGIPYDLIFAHDLTPAQAAAFEGGSRGGGAEGAPASAVPAREARTLHRGYILEREPSSPCRFPVQNGPMTDLLEKAVAAARGLPPDLQDEVARMVLAFAGGERPAYQLTPEEEAEEDEADAAEARGDYATDAEVRAIWAKHGL